MLVEALAGISTPLVIVVFAGRPLALGRVPEVADALVYAWHGGIAGPEGVADLLFGLVEPSARLAVTLPTHPGETPLSHAVEPTGRPYPGHFQKFRTGWLDQPDEARGFPFGFGLGYAPLVYGRPQLSADHARGVDGRLTLSVEVTNAGSREASETVQLYVSDPVARMTRPGRSLAAFRKLTLSPGQSREVAFDITAKMLRYPLAPSLEAAEWVWDPGLFRLHVGPNSRDTQSVEITWHV
jgi:beta-glucosidase